MGKKLVKFLLVSLFSVLCMTTCIGKDGFGQQGEFIFDALYPQTSYSAFLDASIHVVNYLEDLELATLTRTGRTLIQDAVIGRVMNLQLVASDFFSECDKGALLLIDDIDHLLNIVCRAQKLYQSSMPVGMRSSYVMEQQLGNVQVKLENLLQKNMR